MCRAGAEEVGEFRNDWTGNSSGLIHRLSKGNWFVASTRVDVANCQAGGVENGLAAMALV
jgi:hypothetical protein